jgi:hypothetical protein
MVSLASMLGYCWILARRGTPCSMPELRIAWQNYGLGGCDRERFGSIGRVIGENTLLLVVETFAADCISSWGQRHCRQAT